MRFLAFLLPALAVANPLPATPALEERFTAPAGIQILRASYSGSGCGSGTVGSLLSSDKTTLTLVFDSYIAAIGPETSITQDSKNCLINIALTYPSGYQYSVVNADYRGYAALDKGVTGTQTSSYYFTGLLGTIGLISSTTTAKLVGPMADDYLVSAATKSASLVLSPCGALGLTGNAGLLAVNTRVTLASLDRTASGLMTTDSADFKTTQVLKLNWRKCSLLGIGL